MMGGVSTDIADAVRAHMHAWLGGPEPQAASVTFLGLEPVEVLRFNAGGGVRFVTAGCARHPMTAAGDAIADPVGGPRAELVLELRAGAHPPGVHRVLAVLAAAPAVEGLVLQADALLDLSEPLWAGVPFTAVLLGPSDIPELPLDAPAEPVHFLAVAPVTATEAAWVRVRGADALRKAWQEAGIDIRDPQRPAAAL